MQNGYASPAHLLDQPHLLLLLAAVVRRLIHVIVTPVAAEAGGHVACRVRLHRHSRQSAGQHGSAGAAWAVAADAGVHGATESGCTADTAGAAWQQAQHQSAGMSYKLHGAPRPFAPRSRTSARCWGASGSCCTGQGQDSDVTRMQQQAKPPPTMSSYPLLVIAAADAHLSSSASSRGASWSPHTWLAPPQLTPSKQNLPNFQMKGAPEQRLQQGPLGSILAVTRLHPALHDLNTALGHWECMLAFRVPLDSGWDARKRGWPAQAHRQPAHPTFTATVEDRQVLRCTRPKLPLQPTGKRRAGRHVKPPCRRDSSRQVAPKRRGRPCNAGCRHKPRGRLAEPC